MKRWIIITGMLAFFGNGLWAQQFSIALSRDDIKIGEQTELTLVVNCGPTDTVVWPSIGDTLIKEIEVLKASAIDTSFEGEALLKVMQQKLLLTSFDTGYHPIEPLVAVVNGAPVLSNPTLLGVSTVQLDSANSIRDIKAIEAVPFSLKEWLQENWKWLLGGLLAVVLITVLAYWHSLQKKQVPKPEKVEPPKPPFEWAMERLEHLEQQKLWQQDRTKEYYSLLTEIVREYIERQFYIPALEQTSDELITSLRHSSDFSSEQVGMLKQTLLMADLVKFAKERSTPSQNESSLTACRQFITASHRKIQESEKTQTQDSDG